VRRLPLSDRITCRVAVADDDDFDRAKILSSLTDVLESADILENVSIESFSDAHAIAKRIDENIGPEPPWDIILSDVLMPHPKTNTQPVKNGAFFIAEAIERKYSSAVPLKLAAVSNNPGFLASNELLRKFNDPENANWFFFFVKGAGVTQARGVHLSSEEAWERALRQMIMLRASERWGSQLLRRMIEPVTFLSASSIDTLTKAASVGGSKKTLVVTLVGEPGAGKGVVARLLHHHRMAVGRSHGQFVSYSCLSSLDPQSVMGEIFGVKKGAYPSALPIKGKLELAEGGTMFLDQIQELLPEIQNKLVQVMDDRRIPKIGESEAIEFTGLLIVCATTSPLVSIESGGSFSLELLRRMETSVIEVFPLRKRREDIPTIAESFLGRFADSDEGESSPRLKHNCGEWLISELLPWPKNLGTLEALTNIASDWGARKRIGRDDLERAADKIEGFYATASTTPSDREAIQSISVHDARSLGSQSPRTTSDKIEGRQIMKKTVVELDLVGYSTIGDNFEQGLDVHSVAQLNQQIQSFVEIGLKVVSGSRQKIVMSTTGDGAILVFDSATDAHRFAQAVHEATLEHNRARPQPLAKRVFRIGAASGEIVMVAKTGGFDIAGTTIARAVRLEAKAQPGGVLVDRATFEALKPDQKQHYGPKETVAGKRDEKFEAYRWQPNAEGTKDATFFTDQRKKGATESEDRYSGPDRRRTVLTSFKRLKSNQIFELIFLLEMPIGQRPSNTINLDQQKEQILSWADENDKLELLLDVLGELID